MARHREETRLGAVGGVGLVARFRQRALGLGAVGDVAADALQLGRLAGVGTHQSFAPGDPFRSEPRCDLLVVDARAVALDCAVALLQHLEIEARADQRFARLLGHLAIRIIGEGDVAARIAHHDQVALLLKQAAGAFGGFLQLPIAVGERFVMQHDLVQLLALQPQTDAQRRQRHAGDREQETRADRKGVRVVAGALGAAAGDEAIGAAEGGREDHEGADGGDQPGMTAAEAA